MSILLPQMSYYIASQARQDGQELVFAGVNRAFNGVTVEGDEGGGDDVVRASTAH